jgi:light-regulated signal transduction histidine kinase (bacteriophytochrome)
MNTEKASYQETIMHLENLLQKKSADLARLQREKEDFIYIASHDLKAPLRKLSAFSGLLSQKSRDRLDEESLSYLHRIETTVAGMQSLIDGLSGLSEIGSNLDFTECDLNQLMNEVLKELKGLIDEKKAMISTGDLPAVEASPEQIKKVFQNIIVNSLRFQPEGQAAQVVVNSSTLSMAEKTDYDLPIEKMYYQIKFADNGIGFKPEEAVQIFKPFKRLHGKSAYPGNGLGLAICKKIIDVHQGIFYAKGRENTGSLFVIILPQIHK